MNAARHEFLARAALATNEHRDVGVGDPRDELAHFVHLIARAEELTVDMIRHVGVRLDRRGGVGLGHVAQTRLSRPRHAVEFSKRSATTVRVWDY
jgi:hypothetical protein